mgnify:FL=1
MTFLGIAALVILVVIGAVYFSTRDSAPVSTGEPNPNGNGSVLPAEIQTITVEHAFKDGTHIVAGNVTVPTPCDSLDVKTRIMESFPEQVILDFETTNSGEICAQVLSDRRFKLDFKASEKATIRATMNGNPANLVLIPATYEDLLEFDIFIKG